MLSKFSQKYLYYTYIAAGFILLLLFFYSDFALGFHFPKPDKRMLDEIINDNGKHLQGIAKLEGDIHFNDKGLVLRPGEKCGIQLQFEKTPNEGVIITPWFYKSPGVKNVIGIIRDDKKNSTISDTNFQGQKNLNLTEALKGSKSFTVILFAEVSKTAPQKEYIILQRLKVELLGDNKLPPLPEILFIYVCFLILLTLLLKIPTLEMYAPYAGFASLILLSLLFNYFGNHFISNELLGGILLGIFWYMVVFKRKDMLPAAAHLTFIFLLIIAFDIRWKNLETVLNKQLDPDAVTYLKIAHLKGLFNTDFREPFFIWMIKLFSGLFGESDINLRLLTILLSLVIILITYLFALFVFRSYSIGLFAALFMGITQGFIYQNTRGLRLEAYCICVMLFLLMYFFARGNKKWWTPLLFAFSGGLILLNMSSALGFVYLVLIMAALLNRWKWRMLPIVFILPMLMIFPHLLNNKKNYGDYLFSANVHTKIFRNYEFAGQPGFPTKEEVTKNGYAGADVTPFHYIFGMHKFSDVAKRTFKGIKWILFEKDIPYCLLNNNWIIFYFFIIGLIIAIFIRWEIVVLLFLLNLVTYFFAGTQLSLFDWRLIAHIAPIVFLLAALGLERMVVFWGDSYKAVILNNTTDAEKEIDKRDTYLNKK